MTFSSTDILTWSTVAGSEPMTLTYFGDGESNPNHTLNAFGVGRSAVYFRAGKMTATVAWMFPDLTSIFVGNLDFANLGGAWVPRWLDIYNQSFSESDWNSPYGWVIACFDSIYAANGFVADRNWSRPVDLFFDPNQNYIVVTRKQAGTITAWLRPFGGATITASGPTDNVAFDVDTLAVGGASEAEAGLHGMIGHIGLWNRGLTEAEVLAAMNYLGGLYE